MVKRSEDDELSCGWQLSANIRWLVIVSDASGLQDRR